METTESLLKKALLLKPQDRFLLIDGLIHSYIKKETSSGARLKLAKVWQKI